MLMIFGIILILYSLITGGLLIFGFLSAFGTGVSNSLNILIWILILPLLPIVGIVYLIDFMFHMFCYGKTRYKYKKELYEQADKNIIIGKYPELFEMNIFGDVVKLHILECEGIYYACDNPDSLVKYLKSTDSYCKVYNKKKEKYNGKYKLCLTKNEIKEFLDQLR